MNRKMKRWFLTGALMFAFSAILVGACSTATPTTSPVDVVKAYEDA